MIEVVPGSQVPDEETVFRLAVMDSEGNIPPNWFNLSSEDLREVPPSASVWSSSLTTVTQACAIYVKPEINVAGYLLCREVRAVKPEPFTTGLSLTVEHRPLVDCPLPGAEGHCGIVGLRVEKGIDYRSDIMLNFRLALSKLARPIPL